MSVLIYGLNDLDVNEEFVFHCHTETVLCPEHFSLDFKKTKYSMKFERKQNIEGNKMERKRKLSLRSSRILTK